VTSARAAVLDELAAALAAIERGHPVRVGIDGIDAAGKTTLADELAPLVDSRGRPVLRVSVDDFHRPREARYRRGELSPEASTSTRSTTRRFAASCSIHSAPNGDRRVRTRAWDHRVDAPVPEEWVSVPVDTVLLCDGVFLQRDELRDAWDATVFVEAELDVAVERAVERDSRWMPSLDVTRERYRLRYTPAQLRYLEEQRPAERADFVLHNTDPSAPTLDFRRA
jgi:uridine kinase